MMIRQILIGLGAIVLSACATSTPTTLNLPTEVVVTATPTNGLAVATPVPDQAQTPQPPVPLRVWFPEALAPTNNAEAAEALAEMIAGFEALNPGITIDFRLKRAADVGGILSTLRAANPVAPSALPQMTLMRRADLITAVNNGLIAPINAARVSAILEDLPDRVIALGRVNGELYGIPYTIDVQHFVVDRDAALPDMASFEGLLMAQPKLLFPAGRPGLLNDLLAVQYREAAGTLGVNDFTLDEMALRSVLRFYETASAIGMIPPEVPSYTTSADYRALIETDPRDIAALVSSTTYRRLRTLDVPVTYAPIPTASGMSATQIDGWVWVITTNDTEGVTNALLLLDWMSELQRQANYTRIIGMLPSQRAALRIGVNADYAAFIESLLANATLPLSESVGGTTARLIQSAFLSVISGDQSADEAVNALIAQASG